ncbi:MAG: glutaredoxin-1 [Benniella sp.]|nr:MAG: glutaredoxin-1 [Benniella sp.]
MGQSSSSLTPEMTAQIKSEVDALIADNGIVVFSKSYCPYCTQAKKFLKALGGNVWDQVVVVELDERDDGGDVQNYLFQLTKQRTVPNIFIAQQHVGGCSDLTGLGKKELDALLEKLNKPNKL